MNKVQELVKNSINARKVVEEGIKKDSETILEGFTLTSLGDLRSQLIVLGESFLDDYFEEIQNAGIDGMELAKGILEIAKGTESAS